MLINYTLEDPSREWRSLDVVSLLTLCVGDACHRVKLASALTTGNIGHESKQGTTFVALLASNRPSSKQSKLTSLTALRLADWLMKRLPSRCCHHHQWPRPPWSLILRQMVFHLIIRKAYCFLGNQRMSSNWEGLIHWKRSKSCKFSEGVCR